TLAIPSSAVTADSSGTPCVWVYDAATATVQRRVVHLGTLTKTGRTVVLSGLQDGEQIVAAGADVVVEGMRVTPLDTAE
ncbi:MAG: efflux RND transporter periplasmic adaptor subunit, partial [bacterium]|nr:efflux RND transporter periplasmic adaptor subunit [bacterium]